MKITISQWEIQQAIAAYIHQVYDLILIEDELPLLCYSRTRAEFTAECEVTRLVEINSVLMDLTDAEAMGLAYDMSQVDDDEDSE